MRCVTCLAPRRKMAVGTHEALAFTRLCAMVDDKQIVAQAARHVAITKYGVGNPTPYSDSFNHAWFQRVFKLPSVVAVLTAYTHDDVVAIPAAESSLRTKFSAVLAKTGAGFAFGSPCTMSDIIFLEEVRARGGELWLVLPVPQPLLERYLRDRFEKVAHVALQDGTWVESEATRLWRAETAPAFDRGGANITRSLSSNAGERSSRVTSPQAVARRWIMRFRSLIDSATKVDVSNALTPEVTSANMHYCGMVLYGLAVMKAEKMGVPVERIFIKVRAPWVGPGVGRLGGALICVWVHPTRPGRAEQVLCPGR